jgi:hypothetical protein
VYKFFRKILCVFGFHDWILEPRVEPKSIKFLSFSGYRKLLVNHYLVTCKHCNKQYYID